MCPEISVKIPSRNSQKNRSTISELLHATADRQTGRQADISEVSGTFLQLSLRNVHKRKCWQQQTLRKSIPQR